MLTLKLTKNQSFIGGIIFVDIISKFKYLCTFVRQLGLWRLVNGDVGFSDLLIVSKLLNSQLYLSSLH